MITSGMPISILSNLAGAVSLLRAAIIAPNDSESFLS